MAWMRVAMNLTALPESSELTCDAVCQVQPQCMCCWQTASRWNAFPLCASGQPHNLQKTTQSWNVRWLSAGGPEREGRMEKCSVPDRPEYQLWKVTYSTFTQDSFEVPWVSELCLFEISTIIQTNTYTVWLLYIHIHTHRYSSSILHCFGSAHSLTQIILHK